jgi:ribonuclease HII
VDGNKLPLIPDDMKAEAVIKGDARVYNIAAASIIAKVTRDRIMKEVIFFNLCPLDTIMC